MQLFLQRDDRALHHWQDVSNDIDAAHASPSWARLLDLGGPAFVANVCELYYTTNLNITHLGIKWVEDCDEDVYERIYDGVQRAYERAKECQGKNYWGAEHGWKPSQVQKVKELVRYAAILRVGREPSTLPFADLTLRQAERMSPGSKAVEKRRKVEGWKRVAGPVDTSAFDGMMRMMAGMGEWRGECGKCMGFKVVFNVR